MIFNFDLASSSGKVGLRFGLLRLDGAWEPGFDDGADRGKALMLFARELGILGPSRKLPGPLPR